MRLIPLAYSRWMRQWSVCFLVFFATSCHSSATPGLQGSVNHTGWPQVLNEVNLTLSLAELTLENNVENTEGIGNCWSDITKPQNHRTNETNLHLLFTKNCSLLCKEFQVKSVEPDWIRLATYGPHTSHCLVNFTSLKGRVVVNVFWITSSWKDIWIYTGKSTDVIITWDFLSVGQKALEIVIACYILSMTIVTVLGNGVVIVTLVGNSNKFDPFWMTRTSLAITDLVRGAFIMTFALSHTIFLMKTESNLSESMHSELFSFTAFQPLFVRSGYATFYAFFSGLTEVMTFQLQCWLAIERLLMSKYSRDRRLLLLQRGKIINCIMWLVGTVFPLLVLTTGKLPYFASAAFDSVTKLPLFIPADTELSPSYSQYWCFLVYIFCLYLITLIVSIRSVAIFKARAKEEMVETVRDSTFARAEQQERENQRIQTTMKLILILYVVSATPRFISLIPGLESEARPIYFLCRWAFIASSSWNWYLFNFRGRFFLDSLSRLLLQLPRLPRSLRELLENLLVPISDSNIEWGNLWYELEAEIEKKKFHPSAAELT
ncbi:uncharacterized protein [Macrobrachium rosenbergii]|uniref:uncharacterized protein n=1 Tax=Macrobrachium rosenbergii TaxID=79674 RepID=UPI0034D7A8E8